MPPKCAGIDFESLRLEGPLRQIRAKTLRVLHEFAALELAHVIRFFNSNHTPPRTQKGGRIERVHPLSRAAWSLSDPFESHMSHLVLQLVNAAAPDLRILMPQTQYMEGRHEQRLTHRLPS